MNYEADFSLIYEEKGKKRYLCFPKLLSKSQATQTFTLVYVHITALSDLS